MKIAKIVAILLIVLIVIAYSTSDYFIEKKLRTELSRLINKDSLNLYTYEFSSFNLSLINGSITLKGVKLNPSIYALESIKSDSTNVRTLVYLSLDQIKMTGFEINHFLKTKEIIVDKFILKNPHITYIVNSKKKRSSNSLTLNNIFSHSFKQALLNKFSIKNASILAKDIITNKELVNIKNFNFELTNAFIDATTIQHFSPFNYDNLTFTADNLKLDLSKNFTISTGKISFNSKINTTSITNFKLQPNYSQGNFSKKYNVQKQWVAVTLKTLKITDINFEELIEHGNFEINKLTLENANVGLYKDKSAPEPPFKKKLLPASALKQLPIVLSIDTIEVKNSRIVINEKSKKSGQVSDMNFEKLNATIYSFTNDSIKLLKNKFLTAHVETLIMNASLVKLDARFDLLSNTDEHFVRATVGITDPTIFNKVLEPMMLIVVKSGKINTLNYQYKADDQSALGTLDFEYENIKIKVLGTANQTKQQGLLSLAANTVLKTNNIKGSSNYVQGVIKTKRVQSKNIFPYLWNTVQSGIIYTMAPAFSDIKKEEKKAKKKQWFKKK